MNEEEKSVINFYEGREMEYDKTNTVLILRSKLIEAMEFASSIASFKCSVIRSILSHTSSNCDVSAVNFMTDFFSAFILPPAFYHKWLQD